jgi:hypothetical protein
MQHRHILRVEKRHNVSPCMHTAPVPAGKWRADVASSPMIHRLRGGGDARVRERSLSSVSSVTQVREAYAGDEVQS